LIKRNEGRRGKEDGAQPRGRKPEEKKKHRTQYEIYATYAAMRVGQEGGKGGGGFGNKKSNNGEGHHVLCPTHPIQGVELQT